MGKETIDHASRKGLAAKKGGHKKVAPLKNESAGLGLWALLSIQPTADFRLNLKNQNFIILFCPMKTHVIFREHVSRFIARRTRKTTLARGLKRRLCSTDVERREEHTRTRHTHDRDHGKQTKNASPRRGARIAKHCGAPSARGGTTSACQR
jgi:hypothetical protein